ncbi:MAG: TIGR01777 family oxidoreductase [Melioribacteraceae bacterium]|jgi:uncharacterized protein (TIGR01777 family)|nr:TIGR01777 family oxidoreductase [Melioribacteraceae bacterium]
MKTILIAGGSGQIGIYLGERLIEKGYRVSILSRRKIYFDKIQTYLWDVEKGEIDEEAIRTADYIINLSGANIGEKRWCSKRKNEILRSRVDSNKLLFEKVKLLNKSLDAFITASAVGYYGMQTSEKIYSENDIPSNDFLGTVCRKWEEESNLFETLGIRTIKIRTGVVFNKGIGALSKMMMPIKIYIGSPLGSGKQIVPWIHIDDLCNIYIKAIEDYQMNGAYNAVAPVNITNKELTIEIAKQLNRPLFLPKVPSFMLKILLGEMSKIVLEGSMVSSEKISKKGFVFLYKNIKNALDDLIGLEL